MRVLAVATALALGLAPAGPVPAVAAPGRPLLLLPDPPGAGAPVRLDRELAAAAGTRAADPAAAARAVAAQPRRAAGPAPEPAVGTTRRWPATDFRGGTPQMSMHPFTLRAYGATVEVWVASGPEGTAFPAGDCRNRRPAEVEVSDAQARALVREFDARIHPRATEAFAEPVARDGSRAVLAAAGADFTGSGRRTVVLVENIRDAGYDRPGATTLSGHFSPVSAVLTDRNVVTLDSHDWLHRAGPAPRGRPTDDPCTDRPALPRHVESTLTHEWYHLLAADSDPFEPVWVDEGFAQYATSVVGYARTRRTIAQPAAERTLMCFQGFGTTRGPANPRPVPCGGPQNSLTRWQDEGTGYERLADYGNAWSFMLFLADRFGPELMRALHLDGRVQGMRALQLHLARLHPGERVEDLLHLYRLTNLLDRLAEAPGARVRGVPGGRVTSSSLSASLDLANPAARAAGGAGPNGADFHALGPGAALASLEFVARPSEVDAADAALAGRAGIWRVDVVGVDRPAARALVRTFEGAVCTLGRAELAPFARFPEVVVVVGFDRPYGLSGERGRYGLRVDGVVLPGG